MTAYDAPYRDNRDSRPRRDDNRPPRGDYGSRPSRPPAVTITKPTPCDVTSNMYKYTGKNITLHHYVVTFTPEIPTRYVFKRFLEMVESNGFSEPYAFDGVSILVALNKFPDVTLKAPMKDGELLCRIEYKHTYSTDGMTKEDTTVMQCLEIVTRFYQKIFHYVDKKKMFFLKARPVDLGAGLEVISGLASTFRLCSMGLYLNLDATFGVFYKEMPVIDLLVDFAQNHDQRGRGPRMDPLRDDMGANFYYDFERLIKSLQVSTTHREKPSVFKVSGILVKSASSVEFEIDGVKWTVADYFKKTYKPLRYPNLPLVVIKKRGIELHMPLEVLRICPSQRYSRKLNESMTAQMIKIAAVHPKERFDLISQKAAELAALKNDILTQFGMAFDSTMVNCKGVILPPPQIVFADNKKVNPSSGSWNLINASALDGRKITEWKIFSFTSTSTVRPDTIETFVGFASKYGVNFTSRPQTAIVRDVSEFFDAPKAKFNLVILPDKNAQRYEEIKRIAETYQSVYTQCMVASNVPKLSNPSFVSNLLLKINVKLGGSNWCISRNILQDKPTIVIGIDVTHPGVEDLNSPSIASIVASMDYRFVGYKTIIEQQERRQEIVKTLKANIQVMLKSHYSNTKKKPERILVFRDGVGDSTFDMVYAYEIKAIEEACQAIDKSYTPAIDFVIAQKRHSVRFKSGDNNLTPGTVVDELSSPGVFEFYLVSHHAIQGTAKPVRYVVYRNDSKFTNMQMYEITYGLCHLYARATKAVSVVSPVYYADLAAARGKCYLEKNKDDVLIMRQCDKEIQKSLYYL